MIQDYEIKAKTKMIKAVVFIEGEPYRVTEFQDSEKLFEKHYESHCVIMYYCYTIYSLCIHIIITV